MPAARRIPSLVALAAALLLGPARPAAADVTNPSVLFTIWDNPALTFEVTLFADQAPVTVANFLNYVNNGSYTNTIIHRTTTDAVEGVQVVQGGGYVITAGDGTVYGSSLDFVSTFAAIQNEAGLSNLRGTIAMALTADSITGVVDPDSATSQWYINVDDNTDLDPGMSPLNPSGYTVFGEVTMGMALIDQISSDLEKGNGFLPVGSPSVNVPFSGLPVLPNSANPSNPYFVVITDVAPVPEPSTWALAGIGLAGAALAGRRRLTSRRASAPAP
jgi:cyclophilin family peptidyl-prolyl cis-trans isomerase